MAMTPALIDLLTRILGVGTGIVAGVAAMWKFVAWWQDRGEQARLDSATFFLKSDAEPWRKAFGEEELTRIHFRRLTGVDRRSGHQAVLRLHERLGQTDDDWQTLGKAGRYVRTRGQVATIRKLNRRDYLIAVGLALAGAASFAAGCFLTSFAVNFGVTLIGREVRLSELITLLFAVLYAALAFLLTWVSSLNVRQLSLELSCANA